MIQVISSKQNNLIKEVAKLSNASFRKEKGVYKVDGFHMFEMAKESGDLLFGVGFRQGRRLGAQGGLRLCGDPCGSRLPDQPVFVTLYQPSPR